VNTKNEAQVRAATESLLDQAKAGTITAGTLGISHDEFVKFLGDSADYLDTFNKGLQDATKNLSNVPDLATLQEQEFRARSAFGPNEGPNDGAQLPIIGHPTSLDPTRGIEIPATPAPGISESRVSLDGEKVTDPITAALRGISGGSSLKDLIEALQPGGAAPSAAPASPAGRGMQFFGAITIKVDGSKDPDATANAVLAKLQACSSA
jgi:hypothetical protein